VGGGGGEALSRKNLQSHANEEVAYVKGEKEKWLSGKLSSIGGSFEQFPVMRGYLSSSTETSAEKVFVLPGRRRERERKIFALHWGKKRAFARPGKRREAASIQRGRPPGRGTLRGQELHRVRRKGKKGLARKKALSLARQMALEGGKEASCEKSCFPTQ